MTRRARHKSSNSPYRGFRTTSPRSGFCHDPGFGTGIRDLVQGGQPVRADRGLALRSASLIFEVPERPAPNDSIAAGDRDGLVADVRVATIRYTDLLTAQPLHLVAIEGHNRRSRLDS
jgi:hypothetical protein